MIYSDQQRADKFIEDMLDQLNECDTHCENLGMIPIYRPSYKAEKIDWILANLPALQYALNRTMDYLFSNGLTTGDEDDDKRLKAWLFSENLYGATNYASLYEAIKQAMVYGESGLRWYEDHLYVYKKGHFSILTKEVDGVQKVVGYYVRKDRKRIERDLNKEEWDRWENWDDVLRYFDDNGLILLDPDEFTTIRNDISTLHGVTILEKDRQRVDLLLSTYIRLNYDIDYDGMGRVFFWEADGYTSDASNKVTTTTELLNNSPKAREERSDKAKDDIKQLAREMKQAGSDTVAVLSKRLSKDVLQIPRVTKATEFFGWIENEGKISAQILDMSPVLLEVGDWSGNVSMESNIDNAMLNTVIPKREKYATQFSPFISKKLNFEKIYFDKYDLKQVKDANESREKVASMIQKLSTANKASENENVTKVIDELSELLSKSLYDEENNLITL